MYETLVQNPKNDIDCQKSCQNEVLLGAERLLIRENGAREKPLDRGRRAKPLLHLGYLLSGLAQGHIRSQIERNGYGRKQTCVVDRQRRCAGLAGDHREQRNAAATCRRLEVNVLQSLWGLPILRSDFKYHVILIQRSMDYGNLGLAESAV